MIWNYWPYSWYWCMERGNRTQCKHEWEEFAVTIDDNACTIHCTKQSHMSLTGFLVNSVEDEEPFASVVLLKANWAANCHCVTVTRHISPRACIWSLATGTMWRKLEPWDSSFRAGIASLRIYIDTELPCFCPQFRQYPYSIHRWQGYCLPLMSFVEYLTKSMVLAYASLKQMECWFTLCFIYIKWPRMRHLMWSNRWLILYSLCAIPFLYSFVPLGQVQYTISVQYVQ